jgi:hypothetical protein
LAFEQPKYRDISQFFFRFIGNFARSQRFCLLPRTDAVFQDYYRDPVAAAHRSGFTELHEILYFVRGMLEPSPLLEKNVLGRAFSLPGPALFCWIPLEARSQNNKKEGQLNQCTLLPPSNPRFQ